MTFNEYTLLCDAVNRLNDAYYKNHESIVPDALFDYFLRQIEEAEAEHPDWVTPESPTQHVGSDLTDAPVDATEVCIPTTATAAAPAADTSLVGVLPYFTKTTHAVPMLSTAKVKTVNDLVKWMKNTAKKINDDRFTIEWKYDGLSCSLIYQDGQLVRAATRGNGYTGDDVTPHALLMTSIPNEIPLKGRVEVRGEVVMPFAAFNKWNAEHPNDRLANPRNAASGSLKSLDPNVVVERGLEFYAYDLMLGDDVPFMCVHCDGYETDTIRMMKEHHVALDSLCTLGFQYLTRRGYKLEWGNIKDCIKTFEDERSQLPVAVDGIVIKIDNTTKREMLGRTEHHPHYLVAYKFGAPAYETTLRNVEYTIGEKTGKRTPVAFFDPVVINGATVTKASCGSEKAFAEKDIKPGDRILVCLANDIIPQVIGKA